jgi:hypothetical protein
MLTIGVALIGTFVGMLGWLASKDRATHRATISYPRFMTLARANDVHDIYYENTTGRLRGTFANGHREHGMSQFTVQAPLDSLPPADVVLLVDHHVVVGSQVGGTHFSTHESWHVAALLWASIVIPLLQLLGLVGVGGLVLIRYRASRRAAHARPTAALATSVW